MFIPRKYESQDPSSSSSVLSGSPSPQEYLAGLLKARLALEEIHDIPIYDEDYVSQFADGHALSFEEEETQSRIESKKARFETAFRIARGDPSDPKWTGLANLAKLQSTIGHGRYMGLCVTNQELPEGDWILANTEEEWAEWEKRRENELRIEHWKRSVTSSIAHTQEIVFVPKSKSTQAKRKASKTTEFKQESTLSFPIVKRNSQTSGKGAAKSPPIQPEGIEKTTFRPEAVVAKKYTLEDLPAQASQDLLKPCDSIFIPISSAEKIFGRQTIFRVPEDFLPPSFPSQLQTSTPKNKPTERHPTSPTPIIPSSPLTPIPSTNTASVISLSLPKPSTSKRPRSPSPVPGPSKILRTPTKTYAGSSFKPVIPTTPAQSKLPTLTELLASSKQRSPKDKSPKKTVQVSSMKTSLSHKGSPYRSAARIPSSLNFSPPTTPSKPPRHPQALGAFKPQSKGEAKDMVMPINHHADDVGFTADGEFSPAKSLSSIADSDESDDEEIPNIPFFEDIGADGNSQPQSQAPGGFMQWNSQINVEDKVDRFNRFLDEDMQMDVSFDDWLREPTPGENDVDFSP